MLLVDHLILLAEVLLLIGTVSSKLSARLGLPVLVVFVAIGMLAGEDGIGRIHFDNFVIAHAIGTLALAVILFDGGLQTRTAALRAVWKPSLLLATAGVLLTAAMTGIAAAWILDLPLLSGLLLGSIVASTDAAAVFSILRSQGVHLRPRVAATLEIESGSNDPMAILLTIGCIELLTGRLEIGVGLVTLFVQQMGIGACRTGTPGPPRHECGDSRLPDLAFVGGRGPERGGSRPAAGRDCGARVPRQSADSSARRDTTPGW